MTATKQFIEDAIEGGWENSIWEKKDLPIDEYNALQILNDALLDPLAWQAVGKTRGWFDCENDIWEGELKTYNSSGEAKQTVYKRYEPWQFKQHNFIDYLADGKDIEEALKAIE